MSLVMFGVLVAGLVLLVLGAELLVRGASRLAAAVGISPLIVGLTVVSFGTSAPELAVSVQSALAGAPDLVLGNVVGSNIFNVLFILGLSALITPLVVSRQLVRLDVPIMIGASALLLVVAMNGRIGRGEGALLLAGALAYTGFLFVQARRGPTIPGDVAVPSPSEAPGASSSSDGGAGAGAGWIRNIALILAGLFALVLGSRWLVGAATDIAATLGVSDLVIGLTVIAAGTSLPEVATSVLASIRGERDIAVGNVVGSNIFNILVVLALGSMVAPDGIDVQRTALVFDLPIMMAVAIACLPIFFSGYVIARWEGALFLGYYVAYTAYLVIHAVDHPALPAFRTAMLYFVIPLTVITLVVVGLRTLRTPVSRSP